MRTEAGPEAGVAQSPSRMGTRQGGSEPTGRPCFLFLIALLLHMAFEKLELGTVVHGEEGG